MGNKKILLMLSLLLPALASLSSCSESDPVGEVPEDLVTVSVQFPFDLGTRSSFGDDTSGLDLMQWSVFEVDGEGDSRVFTSVGDDGERSINRETGDLSETIDLTLMRGKEYVVAVCVSHEGNEFASFSRGKITVNYDNSKCNDGDAEMFAGCSEVFSPDDSGEVSVELTRPFAQINWGSSDLEDPTVKSHLPQTVATVRVSSQLYTVRDVVTGELSEPVEGATLGTVNCGSLPVEGFPSVDASVSMNKLVAMNYVLTSDEESTIDCSIEFKGNLSAVVPANSAAIRANYRTNIYGDFVTFPEFVNISVKSDWDTSSPIKYTIAEAKAIWEEFKSGKDLVIPEGKVLDATPFDSYNVKNGQNIELNGVLKLHSNHLYYSAGASAQYNISGSGLLYIDNSYIQPIYVVSGNLNISDISVKSVSTNSGAYAQFIYMNGKNSSTNIENVKILSNRIAVYATTNNGNLSMKNCIVTNISKPSEYKKDYCVVYINGGINLIKNCKINSYLCIDYNSTNTFSDCDFDSSFTITTGTNTFENCNIGSFVNITGGTTTFNNCIQESSESSVQMTNGTCNINGGSFRSISQTDKSATFLLDGKNPTLTISDGEFYSNSDYSILRITDALKTTIVTEKNKLADYKPDKFTASMVTQEMLKEYDNSKFALSGGRFNKSTRNEAKNDTIGAASGFKIIPWEQFSTGFKIVEDTSVGEE